ncbi:nitrate- and nitrite sensing domain-containing protein [Catenulispora sp. NF23]|uniref:sensor histidine kinase n=1 Tax=Catenulispora pinistramenti TaxID=2705254 RepID=UPI001BA4A80E|nr:ATP-binding protein [Catenulispora pinistramenti]MBS2534192.1 nitrate- and nitrite sensing domain-containing protein [Catenulispora pinistramenti]
MRITRRLGVLVAVPLAAVSGFGAVALTASAGQAWRSERLWSLMHTSDAAGKLLCRLQDERTAMALLLTSRPARMSPDVDSRIAETDAALAVYRQQIRSMPRISPGTRNLLSRIDMDLSQLTTLRAQIKAQAAPALSTVVFQYRIAIADLDQLRTSVIGDGGASQPVATRLQAADLLYQASEATGQEESDVLRAAVGGPLTPAAFAAIAHDRQSYSDAMEAFDDQAPPGWSERPDQAMTSSAILTAQQFEDQISRLSPGDLLDPDKNLWVQTMGARRAALDSVREEMDLASMAAVARLRDRAEHIAEVEAAAVAGTALLVVMISLRLGRPMIRGLRQLRDAANAVAFQGLPAAVEELRTTESLTGRTPEEFADHAGDALPLGTGRGDALNANDPKDELAAVARAFNSVHREALRTAAEQVLLRAGVGATFVALARRGERLTGALTSELDRAERSEQDPDRLARLFVLDHLAARMARNNESLLVLGGEGSSRVRERAVTLLDVVRAALGRIERYTRVDLESVDSAIVIAPHAVDHLVHLCAELLDNATAFSAPDSRVTVEGHRMTDRVIIQIADRGLGMTPDRRAELNAQLAAPRQVDSSTVRAMGLTVVAHLAAWYGVEVGLRARPGGGTVAEVGLPWTVVSEHSGSGLADGGLEADPVRAEAEAGADWPELPFPDLEPDDARADAEDVPVAGLAGTGSGLISGPFSGPAEAIAPIVVAANGGGHVNGLIHANGGGEVNGNAAPDPAAVVESQDTANATTLNGLPVRRPKENLPAKARRNPAPPAPAPSPASAPSGEPGSHPEPAQKKPRIDRDPEHVAATMAAYARGLTGRSGPKSQ